jgi:hypothetical protein
MILEFSDLETIQETALRSFDERVSKADPADRVRIERELARLESQLEQFYSFTAAMARREPDVSKTAELWARLIKICDSFANRAFQLAQQHGLSTSTYDTILDVRSAADELRALHSP